MAIAFRQAPPPAPRIIKATGVTTTSTLGVITEQALGFVEVPAGFMDANAAIELDTIWQTIGANGNAELRLRIITGAVGAGITGTALMSATLGTNLRTRWIGLIANQNDLAVQIMYANAAAAVTGANNTLGAGTINTALAWTIRINTATLNAGDQMALRYYSAKLIPGV